MSILVLIVSGVLARLNQVFADCGFVVVIVVARLKSGVVSLGSLKGSSSGIWDFLPPHTRFEFDLLIAVCFLARFRFRRQQQQRRASTMKQFYIFVQKKRRSIKFYRQLYFAQTSEYRALKLVTKLSKCGLLGGGVGHIFGYSNQDRIEQKEIETKQLVKIWS